MIIMKLQRSIVHRDGSSPILIQNNVPSNTKRTRTSNIRVIAVSEFGAFLSFYWFHLHQSIKAQLPLLLQSCEYCQSQNGELPHSIHTSLPITPWRNISTECSRNKRPLSTLPARSCTMPTFWKVEATRASMGPFTDINISTAGRTHTMSLGMFHVEE